MRASARGGVYAQAFVARVLMSLKPQDRDLMGLRIETCWAPNATESWRPRVLSGHEQHACETEGDGSSPDAHEIHSIMKPQKPPNAASTLKDSSHVTLIGS